MIDQSAGRPTLAAIRAGADRPSDRRTNTPVPYLLCTELYPKWLLAKLTVHRDDATAVGAIRRCRPLTTPLQLDRTRTKCQGSAITPFSGGVVGDFADVGQVVVRVTTGERTPGHDPAYRCNRSVTSARAGERTPGHDPAYRVCYSTVTLLARFRGLSTSQPRATAMW